MTKETRDAIERKVKELVAQVKLTEVETAVAVALASDLISFAASKAGLMKVMIRDMDVEKVTDAALAIALCGTTTARLSGLQSTERQVE